MSATRVQPGPDAPLSYTVIDGFGNVVTLQVIGPNGDLTPKPQSYRGGFLTLNVAGQGMAAPLSQQNIIDLLPALQHFATYGTIV